MRALILGNAGAGKTTLARHLAADAAVPVLSMDALAFVPGTPQRLPLADSLVRLREFISEHALWIIEGCYADLTAAALPYCDVLFFLNPGVDVCVAHCRARPWEPDKFATPQAQHEALVTLLSWVEQYPLRSDEYGLHQHRAVFDGFRGSKREYTDPDDYLASLAGTAPS